MLLVFFALQIPTWASFKKSPEEILMTEAFDVICKGLQISISGNNIGNVSNYVVDACDLSCLRVKYPVTENSLLLVILHLVNYFVGHSPKLCIMLPFWMFFILFLDDIIGSTLLCILLI